MFLRDNTALERVPMRRAGSPSKSATIPNLQLGTIIFEEYLVENESVSGKKSICSFILLPYSLLTLQFPKHEWRLTLLHRSIAEMAVARAPRAAWDKSTRGLDAASALEFVKALRISANLTRSCYAVATHQASQAIYDAFDKVIVLYEGREIYFGQCKQAEKYFITMGWVNPPRQTVGDFLTSVTNPQERMAQEGMEDTVPRTPEEGGHVSAYMQPTIQDTEKTPTCQTLALEPPPTENGEPVGLSTVIPEQRSIFTWQRPLFRYPGALTVLMGVSGAGKTTLLDVLAQWVSIGVVTGDMLVNRGSLPASFNNKPEALRSSAMLRQPKSVSKAEKYDYVEQVIKMLNMKGFAEAVVGTLGEGLNVEQRKLLTIGVKHAAKPKLLLFLYEPTSGLDLQSAWSICAFLRKLAENGQAVLSTIHQPSTFLFQQFHPLLFLAKDGRTVYFGQIGKQSRTLLGYFERNGARKCDPSENPAGYMLEIIGAGAAGQATKDWPVFWKESLEAREVKAELGRIRATQSGEYAMPLIAQLWRVTRRVFQQFWRDPAYIGAKFMLGVGIQNRLFSPFILTSVFSTLVQHARCMRFANGASKAYSWVAFVVSNIVVEIPYQTILGVLVWASYYYPVYGANQSSDKQGLMLQLVIQFYLFTSSFADLVVSSLPDAGTAGRISPV
ncbi:uncharacterized protein CDV56_109348 [Aspergillus thermomutatus]|uniref:AAA+ ATPase domain-containing protein n=1 Tax=Aspergillus thermomutatus TaxID=41047 RepID=A0A397HWH6_ASPTH|nr:uncharacterized protein CDV56_109348 [Aspergillus thermomutatus]RHZ64960.1 hypothetical protein CDV56_109348 [Aspergillus thermomutatus]